LNWLRAHFEKHRRRAPWDFCWRVAVEGVLVSIATVAILYPVIGAPEREFLKWPAASVIIIVLLLAPVFETLLFQAIPIALARRLQAGFRVQVLFSVIPFTLAHLPEGLAVGIGAGFLGGFYLAFTYAHWVEKSVWTALWTTMAAHAIRNTLPTAVAILFF